MSKQQLLTEALEALLNMDVNGHALQDRLQFTDKGREVLKLAYDALGKYHGDIIEGSEDD